MGASGMKPIEVEPLPGKCVESVARERYWKRVDMLMKMLAKEESVEGLEKEVETLRAFLEEADVSAVREKTEEIAREGRRARVLLTRDDEGHLEVTVHSVQD